jgi:hypothetical protein
LKAVLASIIPEKQKEVVEFRKRKGTAKVGEVTVDMVSVVVIMVFIKHFLHVSPLQL